jgi:uncharacterized membrane-anchored protein
MIRLLALLALLLVPFAGAAQTPASDADRRAEIDAAWKAAAATAQHGPAVVALADQAQLAVPATMAFIPSAEALRLLRAYGNQPNAATTLGMLVSETDDWWVVASFIKEGFVRDDDARDWDADALLASLREGTEAANKARVQRGFPELELIGWLEKPAYDASTHRLVWALASRDRGAPETASRGVNYNTYALGREGYVSLNLLTTADRLPADRPVATALLAALTYADGKRYADFHEGTDRVAEYGLAALIGAVAAKKLGLFAIIAAFAVKFAKIGIVAAVAFGAGLMRLLRGGPKTPPAA